MKKPISDSSAAVCRRLRMRRISGGIPQMSCALSAGISHQYLVRIETGRQRVSLEIVPSLCAALGIRPSDLMREVGI